MTLEEAADSIIRLYAPSGLSAKPTLLAQSTLMTRRFSLNGSVKTTVEALNAIVRAHGESAWSVVYGRIERDQIRLSPKLEFLTFDGYRFFQGLPPQFEKSTGGATRAPQ